MVNRAAAALGRKGGKATGASKVRGDSAYYRALAAKRTAAMREREIQEENAIADDEYSGEDQPDE